MIHWYILFNVDLHCNLLCFSVFLHVFVTESSFTLWWNQTHFKYNWSFMEYAVIFVIDFSNVWNCLYTHVDIARF